MLPQDGGISLRRNGKQQACEPCRELKIACDHTRPHCGRCISKQAEASCVYHPAPMTKKRPGVPGQDRSRPPIPKIISRISPRVAVPDQSPRGSVHTSPNSELNGPDYTSPLSGLITSTITPTRTPETISQYSQVTETDASFVIMSIYYGPTSFSLVFTENDLLDSINYKIYFLLSRLGQPLL
jgi:hypothetical protein